MLLFVIEFATILFLSCLSLVFKLPKFGKIRKSKFPSVFNIFDTAQDFTDVQHIFNLIKHLARHFLTGKQLRYAQCQLGPVPTQRNEEEVAYPAPCCIGNNKIKELGQQPKKYYISSQTIKTNLNIMVNHLPIVLLF